MVLPDLRPKVALVTLCLIFVQGRAHQAQQFPSTPPVAQASRAQTAPVLDGKIYPGVLVPTGTYDHREVQLNIESNQGAPFSARLQVNAGGSFGGNRVTLSPQIRFRAGETFTSELRGDRNDVDLPGGSFVTNLARARASYSFSPRVFVQSLVQYNTRANTWSSNFRFGWLQQANTGIFVVYTDSHLIDGDPLRAVTADRSFIVKISRMFDALR